MDRVRGAARGATTLDEPSPFIPPLKASTMSSTPNTHAEAVDGVGSLAGRVAQTSHRLVDDAAHLAHSGNDVLKRRAEQLQAGALQARDSTLDYIQREPLKAVLMAAAGGAALMWLSRLLAGRDTR
jgi:ElaB/YqjD/DUF883 family membrane-anchored ribosome-binding protein